MRGARDPLVQVRVGLGRNGSSAFDSASIEYVVP
jgi:hypothetical protein